jgi:hypothetical protein
MQETLATVHEDVRSTVGDLREYAPEFNAQVAGALELHLGAALTEHLARGGSEEDFLAAHSAHMPEYTQGAIRAVRDARAIEDMKRQVRAHYGVDP